MKKNANLVYVEYTYRDDVGIFDKPSELDKDFDVSVQYLYEGIDYFLYMCSEKKIIEFQ